MSDALLIFGVAGVGKSTVARRCALEWPAKRYVDLATVREVLRPAQPELALSTYEVWRLAGDEASPENLVRGFEKYTRLLWPAVTQLLHRSAEEGATMVLEGAMTSPGLLGSLEVDGLRLHPRMLRLSESPAHRLRLEASVPEGSALQTRLMESFPLVRMLQDHLEELCLNRGVPVIENTSLQATVSEILYSLGPRGAAPD